MFHIELPMIPMVHDSRVQFSLAYPVEQYPYYAKVQLQPVYNNIAHELDMVIHATSKETVLSTVESC
jgi:hypothetical protein